MKVRVTICREIEVDVNSSALEKVDASFRTTPMENWNEIDTNLVEQSIRDVEKTLGIPFGDEDALETITRVCAMDGEPILEW